MRAVEVLDNLKGFIGWEYSSYSMCKKEADECIKALEAYIEMMKKAEEEKH
jgi:hypothetical protein